MRPSQVEFMEIPKYNRPDIKAKIVNAEDEVFWRQVREAVTRVTHNASFEIDIEIADKHAHINQRKDSKKNINFIAIHIWEVDIKPPTLIVPTGQ